MREILQNFNYTVLEPMSLLAWGTKTITNYDAAYNHLNLNEWMNEWIEPVNRTIESGFHFEWMPILLRFTFKQYQTVRSYLNIVSIPWPVKEY